MENPFTCYTQSFEAVNHCLEQLAQCQSRTAVASLDLLKGAMVFWNGVLRYTSEFMDPSWNALNAFNNTERDKLKSIPPSQNVKDYAEILQFNINLACRALSSSLQQMHDYYLKDMNGALRATLNTLMGCEGEDLADFAAKKAKLLDLVVYGYPQAIQDIAPEYGFHFDNGRYIKAAETDRFDLYQVLPLNPQVPVREKGKPIIIVPPYVLGANILAFLPGENKSYVHCFANQGIPTYIRIVKDIDTTEAVQLMTPEEDTLDTRFFCEQVKARHGRPATLNGFCQGGYMTTIAFLSGQLDRLADAHITCVAPLDGSRSIGLMEYIEHLPPRFRDLGHSLKTLPKGNQVIDGKILSWVYKLKSIEREAPIYTLFRDLLMFERSGKPPQINKTAAAINYWMLYDKTDLPFGITQMSFESYLTPVTDDGTLPVKLFNRPLNFKRMKTKKIPWLICIAEKDDLVDEPATLVPLQWVDAEVTVFPKGHTAIATSWSMPTSDCALDSCFSHKGAGPGSRTDGKCRGPVRFQLDLEEAGSKAS
jgi:hypothetical protein